MKHLAIIISNSLAVLLLLALVATPIYFARNFAQVAGVKTESSYLLISQIEKFPGMALKQESNNYSISFTKQAQSQAYLSIFIINNPTNGTKTYTILNSSTENTAFFGESLNNREITISVPPQSSVPISLISSSQTAAQAASFQIQAN